MPTEREIKNFNLGYELAQYDPKLAQRLFGSDPKTSENQKYFQAGVKQYEKDVAEVKNKSLDREKGLNRK